MKRGEKTAPVAPAHGVGTPDDPTQAHALTAPTQGKVRRSGTTPENLLTDIKCKNARPGRHNDGGGLFLLVMPDGTKYWRWKYSRLGRARLAGGGRYPDIPLAAARKWRNGLRDTLRAGRDPIADKRAEIEADKAERAKADADAEHTLEAFAIRYHAKASQDFRNPKHAAQWLRSLRPVFDKIGDKPIAAITDNDMIAVLAPIIAATPETGKRVRQRLRAVFDRAKRRKLVATNVVREVEGDDELKAPSAGVEKHLPALPFAAVPAFIVSLHEYERASAAVKICLEFLALTATRSGEARGARWSEIDEAAKIWTIPAERTKRNREHVVPLSRAALAVLKRARELGGDELVFPSPMFPDKELELSDMALGRVMHRMGVDQVPHGFRSSFADWARANTRIRSEAVELALSHLERDKIKRAYMRDPMMDDRRALMDRWGAFITSPPAKQVGKIVAFPRAT